MNRAPNARRAARPSVLPERFASGAPLNGIDGDHLYTHGARGYTDYPRHAEALAEARAGTPAAVRPGRPARGGAVPAHE
ncbi:hypothetical protein [Streptomyces qinzhouensis]|uniref:Uncharacterized protein n=1 Tax=Streptomyces qinzhouensis TaxID=2599401 RepID=A0A5B8JDV3_9ACTN|nr:hypothetical protein [Streptomyces qinzhouensis]QDY79556.1 hypothetical protein FQU76_26905 [Streptomyces qinzhouensis]